MKRVIASVLAVSAIAAASPTLAQIIVYERPAPMYYDDPYDSYDAYPYSRYDSYRGYGQWQSINARQARLDQRIDAGVRNGQLTRSEAIRLRAEFRDIAYMEARYRRTGGGLSAWERTDLDRRFDRLEARVRFERRDGDNYRGYYRRY